MTGYGRASVLLAIAAMAALAGCSSATGQPAGSASTPVTAASHQAGTRPAVTYVVTGSPASVTYGPAGSNHHGSVPLHVTRPLRSALFYSVTAQLGGGGSVRCEIKVGGKVISAARASGPYNIASCEISKDPLTGRWSDTNSG